MMNKFIITLTGSMCFLFTTILCNAQETGALIIEAFNFETNTGVAVVHLFREQDDVPGKPFLKSTSTIENGKAKITFSNIPYGDYAAILFQDENTNGLLDHKLGFPNEPMGFSNEWKLSLFSGMPNFSKLKFSFKNASLPYKIAIR